MISFMWDFDSTDWKVHTELAESIGVRIQNHGIILLHEYKWTTAELQHIIDTVRAHNFEIVHPLELLTTEDIYRLRSAACPSDVQTWCSYRAAHEKHEL